MRNYLLFGLQLAILTTGIVGSLTTAQATEFEVGFSKLNITPQEPVRLSGYGNRTKNFDRVDQPIFVRTAAIREKGKQTHVVTSVEGIGLAGVVTKRIAERLDREHGISRERFALANTHSHTAPHTSDGIPNLYAAEQSKAEKEAMRRYTTYVEDQVVASVAQAVKNFAPAVLDWGQGASRVAMNRRIIKGGICVGMGPNPEGMIDETVPVIKVSTPGGKLRGLLFNYACHCTTLVPDHNFVNGDWAGYAQSMLEAEHKGIVALCTIGCGADANPEPRGKYEQAEAHGKTIAAEVNKVLKGKLETINGSPVASFGYAGLQYNRRDVAEFRRLMNDANAQVRRHAANMVEIYDRKRRLPETYPMPIQTWSFGNDLTMVFLGGEVVSPYAHRIKQELTESKHTWVTAYANDVFGYVPSEDMIQQGGYEVHFSQVFYNHPGPWLTGTEDLVVKRVKEIKAAPVEGALSATEAVKTWKLPKDFEIELIASEPLIADPVSFSFGPNGKLWVVQMSDYPLGLKNEDIPGGQVRVLSDTNGDGKMDEYTVFLDGLSYPTGVMPWGKGALVSCAPDILYAEDTDGDGKADIREPLYSGFKLANPQHRVNGFAYGLDNWVHVGSGDVNKEITSVKTGKVVNMSSQDLRVQPNTGDLEPESGRTQYGRIRDDWGHWFGSSNSYPMYHYVISNRYLARNKFFPAPNPQHHLLTPAVAPPVFPASRTVGRFNDLHAANRFTSACGEGLFRDITLGTELSHSAFICEPVHNLIHRSVIQEEGVTFKGERAATEQKSEFLASTDVWSRPVRITTGPDGALWFADMYRHVIEHPQWIPDEWQKMLDVRAGEDKGRIYRVYRKGHRPKGPLPNLNALKPVQLAENLKSNNGPIRDLTQQLLVNRNAKSPSPDLIQSLTQIALHAPLAVSRVQALHTLAGLNSIDAKLLSKSLTDADWHVQRAAVILSEPLLNDQPELGTQIAALISHNEVKLKLQIALTLGEWKSPEAAVALAKLGVNEVENSWVRAAVLSSSLTHAEQMTEYVLAAPSTSPQWAELVQHLIVTALGSESNTVATKVLNTIVSPKSSESTEIAPWQYSAMGSFLDALERMGSSLTKLNKQSADQTALWNQTNLIFEEALSLAQDEEADAASRKLAIRLLGKGLKNLDSHLEALSELLAPQIPAALQNAAIKNLSSTDNKRVPEMLLLNWRSYSPSLQNSVTNVLLSRSIWTKDFLAAIKEGSVAAIDLDPATRSRLTSLPDEALRTQATQLLAATESADRTKIVESYKPVANLDGNFIRGSLVFRRACSSCHSVRQVGQNVGPNLAALSDKSASNICLAVFDPNKAVEGQYRTYIVVMNDGRSFNGMIVSESSISITLAENTGTKRTLLRTDIDELINTRKSFMPEGLEKDLTHQDMADLISFLRSRPSTGGTTDERLANKTQRLVKESAPLQLGTEAASPVRATHLGWFGEAKIAVSMAGSAATHVTCETTVIPAEADQIKPQTVIVPIAMKTTKAASHPFELSVGEKLKATISATNKDTTWLNQENGLLVRYMVLEASGSTSSGVLEVQVPGPNVTPGKPLTIKIMAAEPGTGEYIGIAPLN